MAKKTAKKKKAFQRAMREKFKAGLLNKADGTFGRKSECIGLSESVARMVLAGRHLLA